MKNNRSFISYALRIVVSIFVLAFFVASPVANAIIEPPHKEIEYCYRIDNISAFPDYVLIARFPSGSESGTYGDQIQLKENECYARNTRDQIAAVLKEFFRESDMEIYILDSGIRTPVSPVKVYDLDDPRKKIEDVFTIDTLDYETFSLRLAKKIVELDNGAVEEKVYTTAEEGMADPPATGYEYTEAPTTIDETPIEPDRVWDRQDWATMLVTLALIFIFHFYIAAALFVLARKFSIRHRWRAWIPIVNLYLIIRLANRPQRLFWFMTIAFFLGLLISYAPIYFEFFGLRGLGLELIFLAILLILFPLAVAAVYEVVMLAMIFVALAVRCGRPGWWGPLMVLVPPVGLVLLGVLAWSKQPDRPTT